MPSVQKPDFLSGRILTLEAGGGPGEEVMLAAPSRVQAGAELTLGVSLLDKDRLPSVCSAARLDICEQRDKKILASVEFRAGEPCSAKLSGISLSKPGFTRLAALYRGREFVSNPVFVSDERAPSVFWGDPHMHTTLGDCHYKKCRTRNLAYCASRWAYHLDWCALTDHISVGKRGTPGKWKDNVHAAELFNAPREFTSVFAYEASMNGGKGGDNNVYFLDAPDKYIDPWEDNLDTKQLGELLADNGKRFIMVPHHTTRSKKHGEISPYIYPGPERMPLVEIHSKWGTSEYRGNPTPLHEINPGPSYVRDLLKNGYPMGFVGGTDTHTTLTFTTTLENPQHDRLPGLTAVLCGNNTRADIFGALSSRCCYAACGERMYLDVKTNGLDMGTESCDLSNPPLLEIRAASMSGLSDITVVRNGEEIYSLRPDGWSAELRFTDNAGWYKSTMKGYDGRSFVYYYVRVSAENGSRAWSSPVWFTD